MKKFTYIISAKRDLTKIKFVNDNMTIVYYLNDKQELSFKAFHHETKFSYTSGHIKVKTRNSILKLMSILNNNVKGLNDEWVTFMFQNVIKITQFLIKKTNEEKAKG